MAFYKAQPYQEFKESLADSLKVLASGSDTKIFVCLGASDFFVHKASLKLSEIWCKDNGSDLEAIVDTYEAAELTAEKFRTAIHSADMFSPESLVIIKRIEKNQGFPGILKDIADPKDIANKLIFTCVSGKPLANLKKQFDRLGAKIVLCKEPTSSELAKIVGDVARKEKLKLDQSAIDVLIDSIGKDLFKLENEIQKLSLIFHDRKEVLTQADISGLLGIIKEDHAFALDQFLTSRQFSKALVLSRDLLNRGESVIALTGILARHCRNSLKVLEQLESTSSPKVIMAAVRLPLFVVKGYTDYVRKSRPSTFTAALDLCRKADWTAKSSKTSPQLILGEIIGVLAGH